MFFFCELSGKHTSEQNRLSCDWCFILLEGEYVRRDFRIHGGSASFLPDQEAARTLLIISIICGSAVAGVSMATRRRASRRAAKTSETLQDTMVLCNTCLNGIRSWFSESLWYDLASRPASYKLEKYLNIPSAIIDHNRWVDNMDPELPPWRQYIFMYTEPALGYNVFLVRGNIWPYPTKRESCAVQVYNTMLSCHVTNYFYEVTLGIGCFFSLWYFFQVVFGHVLPIPPPPPFPSCDCRWTFMPLK